jgi:hypothetical protein
MKETSLWAAGTELSLRNTFVTMAHPKVELLKLAKYRSVMPWLLSDHSSWCTREHGIDVTSKEFAALMDEADPLKHFRSEFNIPKNKDLGPSANASARLAATCLLTAIFACS